MGYIIGYVTTAYRRYAVARFLVIMMLARYAIDIARVTIVGIANSGIPVFATTVASRANISIWTTAPYFATILIWPFVPAHQWFLWLIGLCYANALILSHISVPLSYITPTMLILNICAAYIIGRRFPAHLEPRMSSSSFASAHHTATNDQRQQNLDNNRQEMAKDKNSLPDAPLKLLVAYTPADASKYLTSRVCGQDNAIKTITNRLSINTKKRLDNLTSKKPIAVFLCVGPTGVGKTETAKAIAEYIKIIDNRYDLLTFDMSEFYDRHTVSNFIGSSRGYIGSDEPGRLTGEMRKNPYRVVLFDEIEKAYHTVMNTFLQIFDEGRLTDAPFGFQAWFSASVIMLTSNLANEEIGEIVGSTDDPVIVDLHVRDTLKNSGIRPEILARVDGIIPYRALNENDYVNIVVHYLSAPNLRKRINDPYITAVRIVNKYRNLMPYGVREIIRRTEEDVYLLDEAPSQGISPRPRTVRFM